MNKVSENQNLYQIQLLFMIKFENINDSFRYNSGVELGGRLYKKRRALWFMAFKNAGFSTVSHGLQLVASDHFDSLNAVY